MYRLHWVSSVAGHRWRELADAVEVKTFVAALAKTDLPVAGELDLEATDGEPWSVTTSLSGIARWQPPSAPRALLASRSRSQEASRDARSKVLKTVHRALVEAVGSGLLSLRQVDRLDEIVQMAFEGLGPGGRELAEGIDPRSIPERVR